MRKVIFESSVSVDGFIEGPNGELDWLVSSTGSGDPGSFLSAFDTIFFGRKAYERIGVQSATEFADHRIVNTLTRMRKYVFSRTRKHVEGNGMVVSGNIAVEVTRIREEIGKDIWFCGGADILQTFRTLDLIDEYMLTVHPVVLNSGKPLFQERSTPLNLTLIDKRNLRSGVVMLHYRPASRFKL